MLSVCNESSRNINKLGENKINLEPNSKFEIQIQLVLFKSTKKLIRKLIKIKSIKEHNLLASKY